jgi:centromeric protein E
LDIGNSNKKQADNKINDKSSRSHTVFRIELKISEENVQTRRKVINSSEINLVDLAGSEIVGRKNLNELRMREGNNINKSLLALSNVIMKLS